MIVAITGGTGFIGRELVRQARSRGDEVRLLTRGRSVQIGIADVFQGDVTTGAGLKRAFHGADVVVHAAGLAHQHSGARPVDFTAVNAIACGTVMRAAAECGVGRVVLLSSVSVYGGTHAPTIADESQLPRATTEYGRSKLAGEETAAAEASRCGVALRVLRLATVFGAGDPGNVVRLIRAIQHRRFVHIGHHGTRKSMIHRSDAARACLVAADDSARTTKCFNVVGGIFTVDEIACGIATALGVQVRGFRIAAPLVSATTLLMRAIPGRISLVAKSIERWRSDEAYSARALEQAYGFRPMVSLAAGLRDEVEWYLQGAPPLA